MGIRPLQKEIKSDNNLVIGSFDIETDGLFGVYLDGFVKYSDENHFHRGKSMEEIFDIIMHRWNTCLYAHNGQGYEFNYLVDVFKLKKDMNIKLIVAGSRIIGIVILKKGTKDRIELRDSLAIMPMSLKQACKAYNVEGYKGDIGLSEGVIYDPNNNEHQHYCKNDCIITIQCVLNFTRDVKMLFGCGIGFTAASTALSAWKTTIDDNIKYYRLPEKIEIWCREAYYGGYVYPGKTIHKQNDIISIDRNAAYAAAMLKGVPYGKPIYTTIFLEKYDGIYEVNVQTPDNSDDFMPILPYRDEKGLKWPYGKFRTKVTSEEIKFARQHGYKVDIIEGYIFEEHIYPFDDFIHKCQLIEVNEPDKKPVAKLVRNSLYGKFGTKLEGQEYIIGEPDDNEEWTPLVDETTGEINFSVYTKNSKNTSNYIFPVWACFVTANQRLWLLESCYRIGCKHIVYCDTDSIKVKRSAIDHLIGTYFKISNMYGDVKIDEEYIWFQCLGPKVYYGELIDKKEKKRAKGVPVKYLTREMFEDAYNEVFEPVHYVSSNSTLVRIKKPEKQLRIEAKRCISNFRNSNSWNITKEGKIVPAYLDE